jgi:hypothetical protein
MSNFTYIPFISKDYKDEFVLSSYALPQTPLTFIPDLSNVGSTQRVLWTFGDGTTSTALTATKTYSEAGEYTVNLVVYDCFSKAQISTSSKNYYIKNFIDDTFTVNLSSNIWKNGQNSEAITIHRSIPINKETSNIFFEVYGSNSSNYLLLDGPFKHLIKNYQFVEKIFNCRRGCFQFSPIQYINFQNYSNIFAKIDNNNLVICDETEKDSFLVGLSASNTFYFRDDSLSDKIKIKFTTDNSKNPINNTSVILSASVIENDEVDRLSITSNGIDGEFATISSFKIDSIKFYQSWIPFVVKIKDSKNYTVKNFPNPTFNVSILSSGSPLNTSLYTLSTFEIGDGYLYGAVKFLSSTNVTENITIYSDAVLTNDQSSIFSLSGESSSFNIYPKNYIKLEKVGEDFDMTETLKGLRFQETLLDKNILFDEFLRSIFGDIDSSPESLGKKIHEKISNFFTNHYDIDRCEIPALVSLFDMVGMDKNIFESSFFKYPEGVKRMVNLASIKNNKLFGETNKFSENLNPRNTISKTEFGKNLGNQINTDTYVISAGIPIVALEKFSNRYTLLNTYQPLSANMLFQLYDHLGNQVFDHLGNEILLLNPISNSYYMLSSYNTDWGWNLVLPNNFTYQDFPKYYEFYEYVPTEEGNVIGNTVTQESQNNFDNKIREVLYDSLAINNI